jgi:hypothetical protein
MCDCFVSHQVEAEWAAADKAVAELQKSLDATDEEFKGFEHKDAKVGPLLQTFCTDPVPITTLAQSCNSIAMTGGHGLLSKQAR